MSDFILPASWTFDLDGWVKQPPVIAGDEVLLRTGRSLIGVGLADGAPRRRVDIDPVGGGGWFVRVADQVVVADRSVNRDSEVVGVVGDAVAWRLPLATAVGPNGACSAGARVYLVGNDKQRGPVVQGIDAHGGQLVTDRVLRWGANKIAAWQGSLLVAGPGGGEQPGLRRVSTDGVGEEPLVSDPVHTVVPAGDALLVSTRAEGGRSAELRLLDGALMTPRWTAAVCGGACAADGDQVLCLDADGPVPVLRELADGAVRWRGAALPDVPDAAFLGGGLAVFVHGADLRVLARADGAPLGVVPMGKRPEAGGDRVVFAHMQKVHCVVSARGGR